MSQIHFIGGEKGGVGKSVVARLLAQYLIDKEKHFNIYDADLSHGAMMRYYADFAVAVDLNRFDNADSIAEKTIENQSITIVDLAAQASRPLQKWIDESGLLELASEIDLELVFWHVLDDGTDSAKLLDELLQAYGDDAKCIVVRNFGRGKDFSHLDNNSMTVIDIPGLHPPTMRKIDHISASFWAAANNNDNELGPTLGLLERQRVKIWLRKTYEQFDKLFD